MSACAWLMVAAYFVSAFAGWACGSLQPWGKR